VSRDQNEPAKLPEVLSGNAGLFCRYGGMKTPMKRTVLQRSYAIWVDSKLAQDVQTRSKNILLISIIDVIIPHHDSNINLNHVDVINPRQRLMD